MTTLTPHQITLLAEMENSAVSGEHRDPERDALCELGLARHVFDGVGGTLYVTTERGRNAAGIEKKRVGILSGAEPEWPVSMFSAKPSRYR